MELNNVICISVAEIFSLVKESKLRLIAYKRIVLGYGDPLWNQENY